MPSSHSHMRRPYGAALGCVLMLFFCACMGDGGAPGRRGPESPISQTDDAGTPSGGDPDPDGGQALDGATDAPHPADAMVADAMVGTAVDASNSDGEDAAGDAGECDASRPCGVGRICSFGTCTCASPVSYTLDILPIWTERCVGCHAGETPRASLSLEPETAHAAMVGVAATQCEDGRRLVEPGAVDESYLVHKLLGTELCVGRQMPPPSRDMPDTPRPLPDDEIEMIATWICHGAAED
jgi:hypothetical protein